MNSRAAAYENTSSGVTLVYVGAFVGEHLGILYSERRTSINIQILTGSSCVNWWYGAL